MKMTRTLAENIRVGILDAKMDLATGGENHDHEPIRYYGFDYTFGANYNRIAERAYWHTYEHARNKST